MSGDEDAAASISDEAATLGVRLPDRGEPDELLYRAGPTKLVESGVPSADVFRPNDRDDDRLSTRRESMVTPQETFDGRTAVGRPAAGVWAFTVAEAGTLDLPAFYDEHLDTENPVGHVSVYFGWQADKRTKKAAAQALQLIARTRGCLYPV